MPVRRHRPGNVDQMHQPSAQQISELIGVIGQNHFRHLRLRFAHRARLQITVVSVHVNILTRWQESTLTRNKVQQSLLTYMWQPLQVCGQRCAASRVWPAPKARMKVARHAAKQVPGTARDKSSPAGTAEG